MIVMLGKTLVVVVCFICGWIILIDWLAERGWHKAGHPVKPPEWWSVLLVELVFVAIAVAMLIW